MTAIEVYKTYLSLKLHFTSESYDYFKYKGHVRVNADKFETRRDRYFFEKLARGYSHENVVEFFVSNFIVKPKIWVGSMNDENFIDWKKRVDSLLYSFEKETKKLSELCDGNTKALFTGDQPIIIKALISGDISRETFLVFDIFVGLIEKFDKKLAGIDYIWEDRSFLLKKYRPFIQKYLQNDSDKYRRVIKEVLLDNDN